MVFNIVIIVGLLLHDIERTTRHITVDELTSVCFDGKSEDGVGQETQDSDGVATKLKREIDIALMRLY